MDAYALKTIRNKLEDFSESPKLSSYLDMVSVDLEAFFETARFSSMSVVLQRQYDLFYRLLNVFVHFLSYKRVDRYHIISTLLVVVDTLISQSKSETRAIVNVEES